MAYSICPKCPSSTFEMKEAEPRGSNFKLLFVQCSACGCVVGVQDYYNIGTLIHKLAKALNINLK